MADTTQLDDPIIIKKYANRRLYDTSSSSYVTLDHLCELVRSGQDFLVQDAKTGEDLTRSVLTQIIFEQENKGGNALPLNFLRQVIRFYGDSVSTALPTYLDLAMNNFTTNQEKFRDMMGKGMAPNALSMFEDQARRNYEMFERSMSVFTGASSRETPQTETASKSAPEAEQSDSSEEALEVLQKQMAEMQAQLMKLSKPAK